MRNIAFCSLRGDANESRILQMAMCHATSKPISQNSQGLSVMQPASQPLKSLERIFNRHRSFLELITSVLGDIHIAPSLRHAKPTSL